MFEVVLKRVFKLKRARKTVDLIKKERKEGKH